MINIKLHHSKLRCPGSVRASKGAGEAGGGERERERGKERTLYVRGKRVGRKEEGRKRDRAARALNGHEKVARQFDVHDVQEQMSLAALWMEI